jgi:hypothetical protein
MSRLTALFFDSATSKPVIERRTASAFRAPRLNGAKARLQDLWQIAIVFGYLVAAMTPSVRRALTTLDRG